MSAVAMPDGDGPTIHLRLIVDASILEIEANGHTMATMRLAASTSAHRALSIASSGGPSRVRTLDVWSLGDGPRPHVDSIA
jgi:sucrose-6-phosphate hydrolase SacC (GH32 family)